MKAVHATNGANAPVKNVNPFTDNPLGELNPNSLLTQLVAQAATGQTISAGNVSCLIDECSDFASLLADWSSHIYNAQSGKMESGSFFEAGAGLPGVLDLLAGVIALAGRAHDIASNQEFLRHLAPKEVAAINQACMQSAKEKTVKNGGRHD